MTLATGTKLGPYEILSPLGAGGMGEVYLANDGKLDRKVAIKVLPDTLTRDAERIARFEREAKLLASLNHPNIAAVYGFDESNGARFLVMEYVEGQTLSRHLDAGALPMDEALDIARHIAEALEEAHDRGIVHRDLKPGNVMITPEGKVKVLDFGLAKAMADDPSSVSDANSPTITANFTKPGVVLGTAAYMSPEQARGRTVDKRTDIWSFGVVLYEMLSGVSPFCGETVSDSIGAILHKDIDLELLPGSPSSACHRVIKRCLERDRRRRLRDIGDARLELESGAGTGDDPSIPAVRRSGPKGIFVLLFLVGGLIGAMAGFRAAQKPPPRVAHLIVEPPPGTRIRYSGDLAGPAVVSPDGTMIAFSATREGEPQRLWVRRLDEPDAREVSGTDGVMFPFWAPDSAIVGFFTLDKLRRVDLATDTILTICPVTEARGGSWTYDGRILFSPAFSSPLYVVDANGGTPEPITTIDGDKHTTHRWPYALSDGRRFLFFASHRARALRSEGEGIYIGYLDGGEPQWLLPTEFGAAYVGDDLLFIRDGVLLASRVDLDAARLVGDLRVVARDVAADTATWHHQFSASAAGILAFNRLITPDEASKTAPQDAASFEFEGDTIVAFDRTGRRLTNYADGVPHADMVLSPNGQHMALSVPSRTGALDLWIYPTTWRNDTFNAGASQRRAHAAMRPNPRRFTFLEGSESFPVWSPESAEIAFARVDLEHDKPGIYRKRIGGGDEELLLAADDVPIVPMDWTTDGKYLVYRRGALQSSNENDLWTLPLGGGEPIALVQSPLLDDAGTVSPDGRWLAYLSRDTTQVEVYVIPFAPAWGKGGRPRRWQVSLDTGNSPIWSSDGKELYYTTRSGMLMAVSVETSTDTFAFTSPQPLFQTPWEIGSSYGVFPKRGEGLAEFVFNETRQALDAPISVILNWQRLIEDD